MKLIEIIDELRKHPRNMPVWHGFNKPHSYRGNYSELAFEPIEDTTVNAMLESCCGALGCDFEGYKGGIFTMREDVICHLANYGELGEEITPTALAFMLTTKKPETVSENEMHCFRLNAISQRHFKWLCDMGWSSIADNSPLAELMLIGSEVGEAANECRGKVVTDRIGEELADVILRTLGLMEKLGLNPEMEVAAKMKANITKGKKEGRIK